MVTSVHERGTGHFNFNGDAPDPKVRGTTYQLGNPGRNYFLYRTRTFVEFRIAAYSQTDSDQPPDQWWDNIQCFVGVGYYNTTTPPTESEDPLAQADSGFWVEWGMLEGSVESMVTTPAGFHRWTYKYSLPGGISESFAKRKPDPDPALEPSSWLAWAFLDQNEFINRTHVTYDVVYDLQVNYAVDQFYGIYVP